MLFPKIFTALALAASTTATGSAPANDSETPADGQYVGYINNAGEQVLQPFSGHLPSQLARIRGDDVHNPPTSDALETRSTLNSSADSEPYTHGQQHWGASCGCGIHLDHGNTDRAVEKLKQLCGNSCYVNDGEFLAAVDGDVVAFLCHGGGPVNSYVITKACEASTLGCGRYVPGSVRLHSTLFGMPFIGYMKYNPGGDLCADALRSTAYKCPQES